MRTPVSPRGVLRPTAIPRRGKGTQPGVLTPGTPHNRARPERAAEYLRGDKYINILCNCDMSQSLARLLVHLVFSTKNRVAFLQPQQLRSEVHAYVTATLRALDCEPVQVGGVSDHVHLLFGLSRTVSLANVVKQLKTSSTKMIREKAITLSVGNWLRRLLSQ